MIDPEIVKTTGFALIVVGLVGEVVALFLPARLRNLEKILGAVFTILIILGVVGEKYGDHLVAVRNGPRELTAVEWKELSTELKQYAHQRFAIGRYTDEREVYDLAQRLKLALENAGWDYSELEFGDRLIGTLLDVLVTTSPSSNEPTKAAGKAAAIYLFQHGIMTRYREQDTLSKDILAIHISTRTRWD